MPKNRQRKETDVQSLLADIKAAKSTVFANFQGLKVSEAEQLRSDCRKEDIAVMATKKTLLRRALENVGLTDVDPAAFSGGVAVFTGPDEVSVAKTVANFAKTHEVVTIYGGILEGKFVDAKRVKVLASLPGRLELLGRLVGTMNSPVSGFVNVLAGNLRGLVSVLNNIKEAKAS